MIKKLFYPALIGYFAGAALLVVLISQARGRGDEGPAQPIAFSHEIHAGRLGLECAFCHTQAEVSRHPGIPPVARCMECHENAATDRPEVRKVIDHWERRMPIEWARVHGLPWHVHFTHKRHVRAGVECTHCHGPVQVEARVRQVRSLKMGWCVSCHRDRGAATDCWVCHK